MKKQPEAGAAEAAKGAEAAKATETAKKAALKK